ncbi:MAG: S46 family peptidase [Flavobacteriales bacterium]|nr:S46 family peptidase [Flavobacteriales bacterium]
MDADPAVRLKYAAKYAQTANYWKYYIGQTKGLKRLDVYGQKKALEDKFQKWVAADAKREAIYGDALGMMSDYYKSTDATEKGNVYALEAGLIGADITLFAFRFTRTYDAAMKQESEEGKSATLNSFAGRADGFFKDYDQATDRDVLTQMLKIYKKNIVADQLPEIFGLIDSKFKGDIDKFVAKLYTTSFLVDRAKLDAFMAKPSQKVYDKDLGVKLAQSMYGAYAASFQNAEQEKFDTGYRLFVDGLRKMQPNKAFYPDANSTMRLTYGQVGDYYPADAVHYDFVTTSNGILEKKDNTNPEFVVDDKLDRLLRTKEFGQYADKNGELITCFISNNDITGGNSGSPVINGDGQLIGLAFDGNWEAMSGDIAFEPELQRTISVDIRYVMWVIDVYAGAKNIIDEIDFVKTRPVKKSDMQAEAPAAAPEVTEPKKK